MKYLIFILITFSSFPLFAQRGMGSRGSVKSDTSAVKASKFVPAPYLNYSRSVGVGIGFVPMYMFNLNKDDTISPQSMVGGVGMATTNKTYFLMSFGKFYLKEDNWRVTGAVGVGNINFQVFIEQPLSKYVDYNTNMFFSQAQVQRKLINNLYGGVVVQYMKFLTTFSGDSTIELGETNTGIGLVFDYDRRSNVYYPNSGYIASLSWSSYPVWLDNSQESNKVTTTLNSFWPIRNNKDVFATRVYGQFGIGDITFNQQTVVGRTDLRGYSQGKYRGDGTVNIQAEYRLNLKYKLGAVFFGGIGTIYGAINENDNGILLPSLGTGIRYNVFPANHMNIGLDVAVGRDDWGVYFRVGEAF